MKVMHNNENTQISILEINRKSIIILLNRLLYVPESRHLKGKYVYVAIKSLKIEYRLQTTSILRNHK